MTTPNDVIRWFLSLNVDERVNALAFEDKELVGALLRMHEHNQRLGDGIFFLWNDQFPYDFCFRRMGSSPHFLYSERLLEGDRQLEIHLRFCDTREYLDTITLSHELARDGRECLRRLAHAARGNLFAAPCRVAWDTGNRRWTWERPKWYEGMGFWAFSTYAAAHLERSIWTNFFKATRRDPRRVGSSGRRYAFDQHRVGLLSKSHLIRFWSECSNEERRSILGNFGALVQNALEDGTTTTKTKAAAAVTTTTTLPPPPSHQAFGPASSSSPTSTYSPSSSSSSTSSPTTYMELLSSLVSISAFEKSSSSSSSSSRMAARAPIALIPTLLSITKNDTNIYNSNSSLRKDKAAYSSSTNNNDINSSSCSAASRKSSGAKASAARRVKGGKLSSSTSSYTLSSKKSTTAVAAAAAAAAKKLSPTRTNNDSLDDLLSAAGFVDNLFYSSVNRAGSPSDLVLRRIGMTLQAAYSKKLEMDLFVADSTPSHASKKSKSKKNKKNISSSTSTSTSNSVPLKKSIALASTNACTTLMSNAAKNSSSSSTNNNTNVNNNNNNNNDNTSANTTMNIPTSVTPSTACSNSSSLERRASSSAASRPRFNSSSAISSARNFVKSRSGGSVLEMEASMTTFVDDRSKDDDASAEWTVVKSSSSSSVATFGSKRFSTSPTLESKQRMKNAPSTNNSSGSYQKYQQKPFSNTNTSASTPTSISSPTTSSSAATVTAVKDVSPRIISASSRSEVQLHKLFELVAKAQEEMDREDRRARVNRQRQHHKRAGGLSPRGSMSTTSSSTSAVYAENRQVVAASIPQLAAAAVAAAAANSAVTSSSSTISSTTTAMSSSNTFSHSPPLSYAQVASSVSPSNDSSALADKRQHLVRRRSTSTMKGGRFSSAVATSFDSIDASNKIGIAAATAPSSNTIANAAAAAPSATVGVVNSTTSAAGGIVSPLSSSPPSSLSSSISISNIIKNSATDIAHHVDSCRAQSAGSIVSMAPPTFLANAYSSPPSSSTDSPPHSFHLSMSPWSTSPTTWSTASTPAVLSARQPSASRGAMPHPSKYWEIAQRLGLFVPNTTNAAWSPPSIAQAAAAVYAYRTGGNVDYDKSDSVQSASIASKNNATTNNNTTVVAHSLSPRGVRGDKLLAARIATTRNTSSFASASGSTTSQQQNRRMQHRHSHSFDLRELQELMGENFTADFKADAMTASTSTAVTTATTTSSAAIGTVTPNISSSTTANNSISTGSSPTTGNNSINSISTVTSIIKVPPLQEPPLAEHRRAAFASLILGAGARHQSSMYPSDDSRVLDKRTERIRREQKGLGGGLQRRASEAPPTIAPPNLLSSSKKSLAGSVGGGVKQYQWSRSLISPRHGSAHRIAKMEKVEEVEETRLRRVSFDGVGTSLHHHHYGGDDDRPEQADAKSSQQQQNFRSRSTDHFFAAAAASTSSPLPTPPPLSASSSSMSSSSSSSTSLLHSHRQIPRNHRSQQQNQHRSLSSSPPSSSTNNFMTFNVPNSAPIALFHASTTTTSTTNQSTSPPPRRRAASARSSSPPLSSATSSVLFSSVINDAFSSSTKTPTTTTTTAATTSSSSPASSSASATTSPQHHHHHHHLHQRHRHQQQHHQRHQQNVEHRNQSRRPVWMPSHKESYAYAADWSLRLHEEIEDFACYIYTRFQKRHHKQLSMILRVRLAVCQLWPDARVEVFGSYATCLSIPSSDLDLVVLLPNEDENEPIGGTEDAGSGAEHQKDEHERLLVPIRKLAAYFKQTDDSIRSIQTIDTAKVPIIKLETSFEEIPTDITFNIIGGGGGNASTSASAAMHSGIMARELVKDLLLAFPSLAPLVVVLKQYLYEARLNVVYEGGLGSYCLVLMVAAFLDTHRTGAAHKVASPQPPRKGRRGRSNSNPSSVGLPYAGSNNGVWSAKKNLGTLLLELLDFYGNKFDYATMGLTWNLERGGIIFSLGGQPWTGAPFVLLDPFDQRANIGASAYQMHRIKALFSQGLKILTNLNEHRQLGNDGDDDEEEEKEEKDDDDDIDNDYDDDGDNNGNDDIGDGDGNHGDGSSSIGSVSLLSKLIKDL